MEFITHPVNQKVSTTFVDIFKMKNMVYSSRNLLNKNDMSAHEYSVQLRKLCDLVFDNRHHFNDKTYLKLMNNMKIH